MAGVVTDVGDKASVDRLADASFERFGRVDVVFNNAGVAVAGLTVDVSHADWAWLMQVNLWGPIHGVEAFLPRIIEQGAGGHLLFTALFRGPGAEHVARTVLRDQVRSGGLGRGAAQGVAR